MVRAVRRGVAGVSVDGQSSLAGRNRNLLRVGTGLDEDALGTGRGGGESIDGFLNRGILAACCRLADNESAAGSSGSASCKSQAGVREEGEELHDVCCRLVGVCGW